MHFAPRAFGKKIPMRSCFIAKCQTNLKIHLQYNTMKDVITERLTGMWQTNILLFLIAFSFGRTWWGRVPETPPWADKLAWPIWGRRTSCMLRILPWGQLFNSRDVWYIGQVDIVQQFWCTIYVATSSRRNTQPAWSVGSLLRPDIGNCYI